MKKPRLLKRFKRALAAFLQEELLELIRYNHNIPLTSLNDHFKIDQYDFKTFVAEQTITLSPLQTEQIFSDSMIIDKAIEDAKMKIAQKMMHHIHVEAQDLVQLGPYREKSIKFVLRMQEAR